MKLIVTIDTEEDNWGEYTRGQYSVENILRIHPLQKLFDDFNVKPTYLISYPVATHERSVSELREIHKEGKCEIGAHCHPWNTPPHEESTTVENSMMCNLSEQLLFKKLRSLHEAIVKRFGTEPISFRSGRWGYSREVARSICKLGYKIDTSITPYTSWIQSHGPDFSNISPRSYKCSPDHPFQESAGGCLIEIPATIGYLQKNFTRSNEIYKISQKAPMRALRLEGVLHKLKLVNRAWLSPEVAMSDTMIQLTRRMAENRFPFINLFFHSPSLQHGLTPFVRNKTDETLFMNRLKEYLCYARDSGIEPIKLSDAASLV